MNIYRTFSLEQIRRKFVTIRKENLSEKRLKIRCTAIYFFRDMLIIGVVSMKWDLIDVNECYAIRE